MSTDPKTILSGATAVFCWPALIISGMFLTACGGSGSDGGSAATSSPASPATTPATAPAATPVTNLGTAVAVVADAGPPPFVFNERCMPYEIDPDVMRANGVDPDKMISAFVNDGDYDGGSGNARPGDIRGSVSPWTEDVDADGNPVPCDEFHTARRRTRYEACHFYDGTPCYFMTTGQVDQNSFTDDAAGRRAFEVAEHFVFYEFVQQYANINSPFGDSNNYSPSSPGTGPYIPITIFTDPYCCGFATGTQTKIMDAKGSYWEDDPLGLWVQGLVHFTQKAVDCRTDFVDKDCIFMHEMVASNGMSSQQIGFPLVYTGDELFDLADRDMVSIRYRMGGDGLAGDPESARYILCPLHEDPTSDSLEPGMDNVQGFPMHIEWQPPSQFETYPDGPRGHRIEVDLTQQFFGPTPPLGAGPFAEGDLVRHFHCLQQTGDWCPS